MRSKKIQFKGTYGMLSTRLDQPDDVPRSYVGRVITAWAICYI
jgi:hypothetical protein